MEEFYSPRMAIESIFRNNLIGIDLDTRAKQLATFALLMKAAQKDRSFLDAKVMPRVLDMPEPFSYPAGVEEFLPHYFLGGSKEAIKETAEAFKLLEQAQNLGSIMKFEISDATRHLIATRTQEWKDRELIPEVISQAIPSMEIILALTDKYTSVVANPPYMGSGNMNADLSKYVKEHYEEGKADLFSVFMIVAKDMLAPSGKYGMINMQSWMFLSSFEKLRTNLLQHSKIDNMLHLGPRTFDELSGEVVQNTAFVITNIEDEQSRGIYYRLVDGRNCSDKEQMFLSHIAGNTDGQKIYYPDVSQKDFEKIPGCPIGYWVSEILSYIFSSENTLGEIANPRKGLVTLDDNRFIHYWMEISKDKFQTAGYSKQEVLNNNKKWIICNKGGGARKWYGINWYVINWLNNGQELKNYIVYKYNGGSYTKEIRSESFYFTKGITWSGVTSGNPSFRFFEDGCVFSSSGPSAFPKNNIEYIISLLNSCVSAYIFKLLSPTLSVLSGDIAKVPIIFKNVINIENITKQCITISKQDWDSHETSWDFQRCPLLDVEPTDGEQAHPESLKWRVAQYKKKWEQLFMQLHSNEEELNRQFIEIYGLQDELRPEVPMDEITILQHGEIRFLPCPGSSSMYGAAIEWNDDVLMKQLLSYAIGCWMGRYRLDKPGLHIAHPNPSKEEVCSYDVNGFKFGIDDDGIIPLMEHQNPFEDDNALQKIVNFVKMVFGESTLTENLNFVEHSLRKSIETYLMKDFWKDHKKMYQNRPIYWLFSSKKGAFQVLVYMHRMNPYTAEKVRTKYLLPYIDFLQTKIQQDRDRGADLSTIERKNLSKMEIALEECLEYHDRLHKVADQRIGFDLDDGVVVNYAKFGDVLAKIK